jgi:outer membrane biosynthesis protein TonB
VDITCGQCRRSYFVPDDLVQGRIFRAKCSHCGSAFSVEVPGRPKARRAPKDDLPSSTASAIPGLAEGLEEELGWLDEAAKEAEEDEVVLLTVQRSRRGTAAVLIASAVVLLAAGAGVAAWLATRPKPEAAARRAHAPAEGGAAPVADVGGLAYKKPEEPPPVEPAPTPEPAPAPVQRQKTPRLAKQERRLLDLLAKKDDVAVVPVDEGEGGAQAKSALDPQAAEKVIAGNRKAFDACISRALRLNPSLKLARRATLVVTVQPSGTVQRAYIAEDEVDRTDLGSCLTDTARRMVFPAFDGEPVDVAMPLSLGAVF